MDIEKARIRLLCVRGNINAIQKRLKYLKHAAKAAGKLHEWRTEELKELTDKFLKSVDEELAKLNKLLPEG